MRQVWGIEKRRFKDDWNKRIWLFDTLVWTVVGYGVEGKEGIGEDASEVLEMGAGGVVVHTRLYGERKTTAGKIEM